MSHAPKYAALIALEQGRLSVEAERRVHAHIDRCDACRTAHASLKRYSALRDAARDLEVPAVHVDRLAMNLRRAAHEQSKRTSQRTLVQALAIAAALSLAIFAGARWLMPSQPNTTQVAGSDAQRDSQPTASAPIDSAPSQRAAATSTSDDAYVNGTSAPTLVAGAVLNADAGELHLVAWQGTELWLQAGTRARVISFADHQLRIAVERGAITSQVAPLQRAERFEIGVNDLIVAVRGTRFTVRRGADGRADVTLQEGKVDVTRGAESLATLIAPAHWSEDTTQLPNGTATHAANAAIDEGTPTERVRDLHLSGKGTRAKVPQGEVAPNAIKHLLARAAPLLRRCHEQSLRIDPTTPSAVVMQLSVAADGRPQSVDVRASTPGAAINDGFVSCLRQRALSWHIPLQSAGEVLVEIPLSFATTPAATTPPVTP